MCDIGRQQQIECYVNAMCIGRSFFAITLLLVTLTADAGACFVVSLEAIVRKNL